MSTEKPHAARSQTTDESVVVSGAPVEVTAERVADFAAAVRFNGTGVPPTILAPLTADVQQQVMGHPQLEIDLSRTLHTAQTFEYIRPIVIGDVLTATATVTSVRPMRGGRAISFDTRVVDSSGEAVQVLGTTLLTEETS